MARDNTLIIFGAIIIVVLVLAPYGIGAFFTGARDFFADFRNWFFEDWGDMADRTNSTGLCQLGMIIRYTDGSTQEFRAEEYTLIPLTITDETQKEVREIQFDLWIKLSYEGEVASWKVNGDFHSSILGVADVKSETKEVSGTDWNQAEDKRLFSMTVTSGDIERHISKTQSYQLDTSVKADLTVTFTDGTMETKSGTSWTYWNFNYQNGADGDGDQNGMPPPAGKILSIQVTIKPSILYHTGQWKP